MTRYEAMAIRVGEPGLLGAFYAGLGWGEYGFGHFDQAIRTLTKAADLCEAAGNVEAAGLAYLLWEWSYMWKGDYDQALSLARGCPAHDGAAGELSVVHVGGYWGLTGLRLAGSLGASSSRGPQGGACE